MGSTPRHITAVAVASLVILGLSACAGGDDDASSDAPAATEAPAEIGDGVVDAAGGGTEGEATAADSVPAVGAVQVPGQAIAIEARAILQADDVRLAVDRITSTVTTRGGRLAAADIDSAPPDEDGVDDGARATLVLEVPPSELAAVTDALEDLGTVLSFEQLAEDVTDQLTDLDTRIANVRASVERVRELYAEAVDIDSIVRLEAELTRRETDLEVLLASQQALEDRVAMSTLTVDVVASPAALEPDDDRPGLVDAASTGWEAFVGVLFAIVLVLAVAAPFVVAAIVVAVLVLWLLARRRPAAPADRRSADLADPADGGLSEVAREPESATRPG